MLTIPRTALTTVAQGTILMNMHLRALPRELKLGHTHEDLLSFNDAYLASALKLFPTALTKPTSPSRCSFLETPIGLATLIVEHAHDESFPWRAALDLIRGAVHDVLVESSIADDDGCEVLYGRAGLLYALIRLQLLFENASSTPVSRAVHDAQITADSTLERIMDSILAHGRYGAKTYAAEVSSAAAPPLMWSWCGKRYLGGAHGVGECPCYAFAHSLIQPHSRHSPYASPVSTAPPFARCVRRRMGDNCLVASPAGQRRQLADQGTYR